MNSGVVLLVWLVMIRLGMIFVRLLSCWICVVCRLCGLSMLIDNGIVVVCLLICCVCMMMFLDGVGGRGVKVFFGVCCISMNCWGFSLMMVSLKVCVSCFMVFCGDRCGLVVNWEGCLGGGF